MDGGQMGWNHLAESMALRDAVSSSDAVSAIEQAETSRGNDGVPWVGGGNAGGAGQAPIKVVGDVTRAGYNLVNGRSVSDTSAIAQASFGCLSCQTWRSEVRRVGNAFVSTFRSRGSPFLLKYTSYLFFFFLF